METMIAIALGVGFTAWLAWKNPKITVNLPWLQIIFEPPEPPPPLLKGYGCEPGEESNRLGDSH